MKTDTVTTQVPLARQIKDFIVNEIDSGELQPGDRVLSEAALARKFSASRMTVNRAVSELTVEGRVRRVQGLGTFVAEFKPLAPLFEIKSISQEVAARGNTYSGRMLKAERSYATTEEAARLEVKAGREIFRLQMLHLSDGSPIQFEARLVVPEFAPLLLEQDFTEQTPSDYLQRNVRLTEVEHKVDAIAADIKIADMLEVEEGFPCLRLVRRTWLHKDLITYVQLIHPGNAFRFSGRFATVHQEV